jgi:hypothetical protein
MCRSAFAAFALAVLAMAGVESAQATQQAKTQQRPGAVTGSRTAKRPALNRSERVSRGAHQTPLIHSNAHPGSRANLSATGSKRTPDEVGRAAGLAIRRQLARGQMERDAASARAGRARNARRPRLERIALRSTESSARRESEPDEARTAEPVPDTRQPETVENAPDGDQAAVSRPMDEARERKPVASATEEKESADGSDTVPAPVRRIAPSDGGAENRAAERNNDAAAQAGDETSATTPIETGEEAGFAGAKTRGAIASLVMPRHGMPASLRGSLASLQRQNDRLDAEGLERIENEADLAARIADKLLVPIPASSALAVNAELEENHRYCRPWTAKFLADLARAHEAAFHRSIKVSSAVRTVEYQKRLMETNGNAAPAEGDLVSPHLTGATIDIAKKGLTRAEMAWMRKQLAGLEAAGKIDVEEEFKQACFHITVYKNYAAVKAGPATPSKPATHSTPRQTAAQADEAQGT